MMNWLMLEGARSAIHTRISELGFETDTKHQLAETVLGWLDTIETRQGINTNRLITYLNPHVYNLSMHDADVKHCLEMADRVCIDGVGIKLAILFLRRQRVPRVVAEHLFNDFVHKLNTPTQAIIIGTHADELKAASYALQQHNENLCITDTLNGFSSLEDYRSFLQHNRHIPLVLIGAGTPKSEKIALCAMRECRSSVVFHIGAGTLKTWAGTKRRGPALMSRLGLEWLHRIVYEPHTRTRYTLGGLRFIRHLVSGYKSQPQQQGEQP